MSSTPTFYVEYDSNISGGNWWLTDQHWQALEAAGWQVRWGLQYDRERRQMVVYASYDDLCDAGDGARWLDTAARSASLKVEAPTAQLAKRYAMDRWQYVTGMDPTVEGCSCCGQPHDFFAFENPQYEDAVVLPEPKPASPTGIIEHTDYRAGGL